MIKETTFRLKNLKMHETRRGLAWFAELTKNGKVVGDVYDDGVNMVPALNLFSSKEYKEFIEWSNKFGDQDWVDDSAEAAGIYKLSEIYADEVEGVRL
jgi:hypothetical protein